VFPDNRCIYQLQPIRIELRNDWFSLGPEAFLLYKLIARLRSRSVGGLPKTAGNPWSVNDLAADITIYDTKGAGHHYRAKVARLIWNFVSVKFFGERGGKHFDLHRVSLDADTWNMCVSKMQTVIRPSQITARWWEMECRSQFCQVTCPVTLAQIAYGSVPRIRIKCQRWVISLPQSCRWLAGHLFPTIWAICCQKAGMPRSSKTGSGSRWSITASVRQWFCHCSRVRYLLQVDQIGLVAFGLALNVPQITITGKHHSDSESSATSGPPQSNAK